MAIVIYKYAYHVGWDTEGVAVSRSGGGGCSCDLSNYYTMEQLQTGGQAIVSYKNIDYTGLILAYIEGIATVTGHLIALETGLWGTTDGETSVSGTLSSVQFLIGQANGTSITYGFVGLPGQTRGDTWGVATVTGNLMVVYTASYSFPMSVDCTVDKEVILENDEESPGVSKVYGTNGSGIKGWYDQSSAGVLPFQIASAESDGDYEIDATTYKDWIIEEVNDDATINLNNTSNGDAGMLEVIMDSTGGYTVTFGTMFTKKMGSTDFDNTAGADNIISWRKVGTSDIVYTIGIIGV